MGPLQSDLKGKTSQTFGQWERADQKAKSIQKYKA